MNRFLKTAILSAAVAATTLATLPAANAGDRHWRRTMAITTIREATISRSPGFSGLPPARLWSASLRSRRPIASRSTSTLIAGRIATIPPRIDERDVVYADDYGGCDGALEPGVVRILLQPLSQLQYPERHLHRL